MNIEELMDEIADLEYPSTIMGRTEHYPVVKKEYLGRIEQLIRQYALDNHERELGELKAKVYVYEKIIANSNFAPMLNMESENEQMSILEGEKIADREGMKREALK